jgi:hypothetical protein
MKASGRTAAREKKVGVYPNVRSVPEREGDRNATGIKIGAATDVLTTD